MKDSFIFYRSFVEAIEDLSIEDQLAMYKAISYYSLDEKLPRFTGISRTIFNLIKPNIDANLRRYKNGSKGGRPKKKPKHTLDKTKEEPRDNLDKTKEEPRDNLDKTKDKANEDVDVNVNEDMPVGLKPDDVVEIFEEWKKIHNRPRAKLDRTRRAQIKRALKTYSKQELISAIEGCKLSNFHMGKNDRGTVYNDIEVILRDSKHIEMFMMYKSQVSDDKITSKERQKLDIAMEESFNRAHDKRLEEYAKARRSFKKKRT